MTLKLITGRQNEGKTLELARLSFMDYINGRVIYSNTPFNFPHILINKDFIESMVKNGVRLPNTTWALDEAWLWLDSRKRDTILSYFYLQSSKDNANIYFTAQTDRQIDIRLKENLHYWIECERKILYQGKFINIPKEYRDKRTEIPKDIQDLIFIYLKTKVPKVYSRGYADFDNYIIDSEKYIYAKAFFDLFDTKKKIQMEFNK